MKKNNVVKHLVALGLFSSVVFTAQGVQKEDKTTNATAATKKSTIMFKSDEDKMSYIIGHQIIGAFEGYRSGHAINNQLLRKLLNHPESWEFVTFNDSEDVPSSFHYIK